MNPCFVLFFAERSIFGCVQRVFLLQSGGAPWRVRHEDTGLIGGLMGVGKTAVSQRLKKRASNAVLPEEERCRDAAPFVVTEETKTTVMRNLCFFRVMHEIRGMRYIQIEHVYGKRKRCTLMREIKQRLHRRAARLKADIPAVFIALRDRDTPPVARFLAALTVGYALSPLDLIPDFIPVLGALDDVLLLPFLVALTIRCIPPEVWARSRERALDEWKDASPKKWVCALPVVAIWGLVVWAVVRAIWF